MAAYENFSRVYDLFMDNIPYEEWGKNICGILKRYGIRDGLVLDLGCGTGAMTEILSRAGYDMIGVDNSVDMLEAALEKKEISGSDILYLLQDMREFELYGTVRAAVSVCDSVNYITEPEELLQVFRLVNNYLDPGGIFLFDLNTLYKYEKILGESVIAENRDEGSFIWENWYDPEDRINEYDLTLFIREEKDLYRKYQETHFQRAYSIEEIRGLLCDAGMSLEEIWDADTLEKPCPQTQRLYFIAREQGK
ncbi:MAG TPA: class I SAM-dependent methyltransferase [Candidatus Choladousia intestinavium]|uniref:Class I SAM-dependent methyltransferase n=1 Tax=Candidatus Choladousia intestinavium TaxID=2840727 RepID=A0A9D1ADA4_9FIRM|nr:class I SAM-dependent methyltransferase [Candidatus Choladousia intestinavium]